MDLTTVAATEVDATPEQIQAVREKVWMQIEDPADRLTILRALGIEP